MTELVFSGIDKSYGRCFTESSLLLSEKIAKLYDAKESLVTSSGMAAISTVINGLILYSAPSNVVILYDEELYCDTPSMFQLLKIIYSPRIELCEANLSVY